jgi:alpha-galactosidase
LFPPKIDFQTFICTFPAEILYLNNNSNIKIEYKFQRTTGNAYIVKEFDMLILKQLFLCGLKVAIVTGFFNNIVALDNGLAKTPPMGWNSWNCFHGDITDAKIRNIADLMVSTGLKDAGYIYLNLDDNWMAPSRDANDNLRGDPARFPDMKALSDYIHSKGLKLGIYGDHGTKTCMGINQSGSFGKETQDAKTFASWGIDYLKYDHCNLATNNWSAWQREYEAMSNALANCGRPIVFSICAWEFQSWMPNAGNLWRTTRDITDKWSEDGFFRGITQIIDQNASLAQYAKPGTWNDPDMLEVGNGGCTIEEYRSHFSMWCIMAAPLIMGNDITNSQKFNQDVKSILLNKEVIAVDQDSGGIQGTRIKSNGGLEVWCKPLGSQNGNAKAVALLNRNSSSSNITVNFTDIGLSGEVKIRDLWEKADKGKFTNSFSMNVPPHGTGMLKISSAPEVNTLATNRNTTNISTFLSNKMINIISEEKNSIFNVSIFLPDGRSLISKKNVPNKVSIPVKKKGIYIIKINIDGNYILKKLSYFN